MYVEAVLKCPEPQAGAWVALTRVNAHGDTYPLGYVGLPFREEAARALEAEVVRRDQHYGLDNWHFAEVVDFVLAQMHPDLPADIDKAPPS